MEDPLKWMNIPGPIADRLGDAAAMIDSTRGLVRIISHYDGDGICSAGILAKALSRCGKIFHSSMTSVLNKKEINSMEGGFELLLFTDMGSGLAQEISDKVVELGVRGIILDHHKVSERETPYSISDGGGIVEVNPRFHGIDGTSGCSGSSLSFLLALAMAPGNQDLAHYSLAGSLADRQHVPRFTELNEGIRNLALDRGIVTSRIGLPLSGRSVHEALITSNDPFIEGISGDREGVEKLLSVLGINPSKGLESLLEEEVRALNSFIYSHLLASGVDTYVIHELFRENLFTEKWGPLQDLAYSVDTCGRIDRTSLGFEVVWGIESSYQKALEIRFDHKRTVQKELIKLKNDGVRDMENIQWFSVDEDTLAGTLAGLAHNYFFDRKKPMLAFSKPEDGTIKVSSRANRQLCKKGLDLGEVMSKAGEAHGGSGGGHDVAAGGSLKADELDDFIKECDTIVGKQIGKGE